MEATDKHRKSIDNLIPFKKGQSGNPKGRPKGKTMKEFAREFLLSMDEEAKKEWLKGLQPEIVWKMAEGNPHNTSDEKHEVILPIPILGNEDKGTDTSI